MRQRWTAAAALACALVGVTPMHQTQPTADGEGATAAAVARFNDAINAHDLEALARAMHDACVFENTAPAPDGARFEGKAAVLGFWERWFRNNPDGRFEVEDAFASGDRFVVRWIYRKTRDGQPWHLRGVDLFRVRDGLVVEKLAYVKG
jgi:ketosteroid isomerase-like protein